jgi:class III poly(R)-hydroxyalkanoic acid synthase PhaE subunit
MERKATSWGQMASDFTQNWAETGTQMWKNWFELMNLAPSSAPAADRQFEFPYFAQRFAEHQQLFARWLKLSFDAWTDMFPQVSAGEDWQQVLKKYTQQIREQFDNFFGGTLAASQDTTQLWQLYMQEMQKFNQLWANAIASSIKPMSQTVTGSSAPWIELNNLYWNLLYEETFGSLMQSPILGPTRELNGKLLRAFDAWTNLYRATVDYHVVLGNVQMRSLEALMRELVSLAEKGKKVDDWREFQQIWSRVADDVFAAEFCDEHNLKVRGKFLNALNTYRIYQQELMELSLKMMNMPVRSEVDEMHKSIHELRKEVKALKKALAKYEFQTSTATEAKTPPAVQPPATSETDELANPEAQPPITDDSQKPRTTRKPRTS